MRGLKREVKARQRTRIRTLHYTSVWKGKKCSDRGRTPTSTGDWRVKWPVVLGLMYVRVVEGGGKRGGGEGEVRIGEGEGEGEGERVRSELLLRVHTSLLPPLISRSQR